MSRRKDEGLRKCISAIEGMLITDPSTETVLIRCLDQLMSMLGSSYGFVYECGHSCDEAIPWDLLSCLETGQDNAISEVSSYSLSHHIPQEFQDKLIAGRSIIDNDANNDLSIAPKDHPSVDNYFCTPLMDARSIYAVIFLCNVEGGIPEHTEARVRPFNAAASCLLRASKKKLNGQEDIFEGNMDRSASAAMSSLLDSMFNAVLVTNEHDQITLSNNAAASMLGSVQKNIVGRALKDFLPSLGSDIKNRLTSQAETNAKESTVSNTLKIVWRGVSAIKENGEKILVDLRAFEFSQEGVTHRGYVMDDISERMQSTADYHATLQRFQVLTNLAPVGILQLDRNWECTYANDTWCDYCKITPEESLGAGWMSGLHPSDADEALRALHEGTSVSAQADTEFRLQSPLGKVLWVKASACRLYDQNGESNGMIVTLNDISEHLSNEKRLQDIAEKDQLTGLINRAFFNDRVEIALKSIDRLGSVALMFLDLDEFKYINDSFGHDVGDTLLQEVAARLKDAMRNADTIARIGGDEFTLLITGVKNVGALTAVCDKVIDAINRPFLINERRLYISCSVGIALAENCSLGSKQLMKQADVALYKAKDSGKNQYRFYTKELDQDANLHILLRQSLKETEKEHFRVVFQPQVNARTGHIVGMEALTRWARPDIAHTSPDKFIKMIEESGLLSDFSDWLFDNILSTMRSWKNNPAVRSDIPVSINLSARQFRNKELAEWIHKRCRSFNIDPSAIILEVTESAFIDDPTIAATTIKKLKNMGFRLSLDDFGTGYSSLAYLRNMELDSIKIDRSFVKDVLHDSDDSKIVIAILDLAKTLKLKVVAEGVDNSDVKNWLIENNCLLHQGFLFYKPLECSELESLLKTRPKGAKVISIG